MTLAAGVLLILAVLLVVACVLMLARRDEQNIQRVWKRLLSPTAAPFREALNERIEGEREFLVATRAWADEARRAGDLEQAERMEVARGDAERRARLRHLLSVKRMLSAIRLG